MFYIEKNKPKKLRDFIVIHWVPPLIMFVAFMGITLLSWQSAHDYISDEKEKTVKQQSDISHREIISQTNKYQDILRAGVGLFNASSDVNKDEWKRLLSQFNLAQRYPGIQGIGYAQRINATSTSVYTSVKYIEPQTPENLALLGIDMFENPQKRVAMELARDNNEITFTDMLVLTNDQEAPQPGFIIYAPVYAKEANISDVVSRRANITGYVYAPIRANELFNGIFNNTESNVGHKISSTSSNELAPMEYSSSNFAENSNTKGSASISEDIMISNASWTMTTNVHPDIVSLRDRERPTALLWSGLTFSILTASFVYLLLINRTRILSSRDAQIVQEAKDELLALASHQLRTPATGVKQYIGLLRDGYAGKLDDKQQMLIEKAYESNERQLSTINQILFIARADAGEMRFDYTECSLNDMLLSVLDEQSSAIKEHQLSTVVKIPNKHISLAVDKNYLRMAIENIVSNAIKYTPDKGKIRVSLRRDGEFIKITIADSGVGVAPEDYPLLFQKFSRIPNELTSKVSGSGIGLYLAQQIVVAHHGRIDFSSRPNKGTKFIITLPANSPSSPGPNNTS